MISIKSLSVSYGDGKSRNVKALADLSLEISRGEYIVLIGGNGSGKSTLLKVLSGEILTSPSEINFNGKDIGGLKPFQRSTFISRVFQDPYQGTAADLSLIENLRLAYLRGKPKWLIRGINDSFRNDMKVMLKELSMGLEDSLEEPLSGFSGGQRQAITVLMSVLAGTEVLLLDEPTAALDPRTSAIILDLVHRLKARYDLTVILVTHHLADALKNGNRILVLKQGQLIKDIREPDKTRLSITELLTWFE